MIYAYLIFQPVPAARIVASTQHPLKERKKRSRSNVRGWRSGIGPIDHRFHDRTIPARHSGPKVSYVFKISTSKT